MNSVMDKAHDLRTVVNDKLGIQQAFSKAAKTYDQCASLQRKVGEKLLETTPIKAGMTVLDLGCGTGFFSQKLYEKNVNLLCVDLSSSMLAQTQSRMQRQEKKSCRFIHYLVGDAEHLPIADHSVDLVFSSLVLQWCQYLSDPLKEIKRVLKPSGVLLFTTLLDGSLFELKKSWDKVDKDHHVNRFISLKQMEIAIHQAGYKDYQMWCEWVVEHYATALALMQDLKGIGATHLGKERKSGLSGKKTFQKLENAYDAFRLPDRFIPATYHVGFGVLNND